MAVDTYQDGQGRTTITSQSHGVGGYPVQTRTFGQGFNITGTTRYVRPYDFFGGSNESLWTYQYDARNQPSQISMTSPQALDIAIQTRNVAGLVTNRRTSTGAMTFVESNWTYDQLGRVTNQTVQKNGPVPVARQVLTYFGNDDVKTLQHHLGSSIRTFTYKYDRRHQIISTTANPLSYFGAAYRYSGSAGLAGRLTRVTHTRTISPTPAGADPRLVRDVNYVYGGIDPEQVTALTNVADGTTYASYTYDLAGNQLTRSYPATGELFEYTYDGFDQLRRVVRKVLGVVTGSEEYWYDAGGQRMAVVKRDAAGTKTELIWFLGDTQAHYGSLADGTFGLKKIYSHLSMGTPVARLERTGNTSTSLEFQFHGLASNTLAAVAQNGTINASFNYAPFGELLESTNAGGATQGTAVHKRRSNDKYEDDLSGLAYYGVRYYDKTLINWTQGDPLFRFAPESASTSPRKANLYSFTLQNALRYIDPDGRNPGWPRGPSGFGTVPKNVQNKIDTVKTAGNVVVDVAQVVASVIPQGTAARIVMVGLNLLVDDAQGQSPPTFDDYINGDADLAGAGPGGAGGGAGGASRAGGTGGRRGAARDDGIPAGHQVDPWGRTQRGVEKFHKELDSTKVKAKDRRAAEQARSKREKHGDEDYVEPASEEYAKHRAKEAEKKYGKQRRREGHDKKEAGEGDRSKGQLDDDYD